MAYAMSFLRADEQREREIRSISCLLVEDRHNERRFT